jgi:hypothetical protein
MQTRNPQPYSPLSVAMQTTLFRIPVTEGMKENTVAYLLKARTAKPVKTLCYATTGKRAIESKVILIAN